MPTDIDDEAIETVLVAHMRDRILAGNLPPGTKLGEEVMTRIFNVNRSRVRRILQLLAADRLVELKANRGAFIATPSVKEAKDVFEARRVIERATTEIVARTIQTPHLLELRALTARNAAASAYSDRQETIRISGDFHRYLCGQAHNAALAQVLEILILRTALIVALYGSSPDILTMHEHHARILAQIEAGRSLDAARSMERCLYALEATLDLRERPRRDVDLRVALGRFGKPDRVR